MRISRVLILMLLLPAIEEAVFVDSELVSVVPLPSRRCQDHARVVCPDSQAQKNVNNTVDFTVLSKWIPCGNQLLSQCPATMLQSVHYQYLYQSASLFSIVVTWDPVNVTSVDKYVVMFVLGDESVQCGAFIDDQSCVGQQLDIPKESNKFLLTNLEAQTSTSSHDILIKLVAAPAYQWVTLKVPYIKLSSPTCSNTFHCMSVPSPPSTVSVQVMAGGTVNVTWKPSSPNATSYVHLATPSEEWLFEVKTLNNVILKNLTDDGDHSVWIEEYSCGCSYNATAPVNFTLRRNTYSIESTAPSSSPNIIISTAYTHSTASITPSSSSPTVSSAIIPVSITVVLVAAVICTVMLLLVIIKGMLIHRRKSDQISNDMEDQPSTSPLSSSDQTPDEQDQHPRALAVVAYALDCTEKDKEIVVSLARYLKQYGVEVDFYDVSCRLDPVKWLEQVVTTANTVICVVNEQFYSGWNGTSQLSSLASSSSLFIKALHLLITANIKQQASNSGSKFSILLLHPKDNQYVPQGYMQTLPVFQITQTEAIIRFIKRTPEYNTEP